MGSALKLRSPAVLMAIGVSATLVLALVVVMVLSRTAGGFKAVSDNAALIGALVALGGVFTAQMVSIALDDRRTQEARNIEQAQRERELEVGSQRAQDDATEAYLDQMGTLLLDKDRPLHQSGDDAVVRVLARARTLTVLSRVDGARKGNVMQFLYESNLVNRRQRVVDLRGADLSQADLSQAELSYAALRGADLREADLRVAYLIQADLGRADLGRADLVGADLRGADLVGADLREADLSGAVLIQTELGAADLSGADLRGAEGITNEELEQQARFLKGATMPNGQKYEDWLKSKGGGEDVENSGPS